MIENRLLKYLRVSSLTVLLLMACGTIRSTSGNIPRANNPGSAIKVMSMAERQSIVRYASELVGAPYRYGGTSPSHGFDCSGFTSFVLRNFEKKVPRTSGGQSVLGRAITFDDAQPGDLLFFGRGKRIEHVAMVVDIGRKKLKMVHSSSTHGVVIEDMRQSDYWKRRVMFAVDLASL